MEQSSLRERIDSGPINATMIYVVFVGFMLNVVDGFDVVAMSAAAPSLIDEWDVTRAQLGPIFSAALVGMAAGAALLAPLADRFGRRLLIVVATIVIGITMALVPLIPAGPNSIFPLALLRLVSGLGIGIIFASGATIASEFAPEKYRNIAVTTVIMGYPFGAMVVGPAANAIIPAYGWENLFLIGGIATLIMGAIIWFTLPESPEYLAERAGDDPRALESLNTVMKRIEREPFVAAPDVAPNTPETKTGVRSLFAAGLKADTISLWTVYFLGFLTVYFLLSWIPTLFVDSGYTMAEGIGALTMFNLGAVLGIVIIGLIATNIKLAKPIAAYFFGSALLLIALYYWRTDALFWLNVMIFLVGMLLQGAFTAMYALAARVYPTRNRATGIGWAAGLGRVGAIISPIVAGVLATAGWSMYSLFLLFALPLVLAALLVSRFRV